MINRLPRRAATPRSPRQQPDPLIIIRRSPPRTVTKIKVIHPPTKKHETYKAKYLWLKLLIFLLFFCWLISAILPG